MIVANKPTIPEIEPLIRAYFRKPGNSEGGSFHIVLCDNNIALHHVQWCLDNARERGDADGVVIGEMLVRMSRTQRDKLSRMDFYP